MGDRSEVGRRQRGRHGADKVVREQKEPTSGDGGGFNFSKADGEIADLKKELGFRAAIFAADFSRLRQMVKGAERSGKKPEELVSGLRRELEKLKKKALEFDQLPAQTEEKEVVKKSVAPRRKFDNGDVAKLMEGMGMGDAKIREVEAKREKGRRLQEVEKINLKSWKEDGGNLIFPDGTEESMRVPELGACEFVRQERGRNEKYNWAFVFLYFLRKKGEENGGKQQAAFRVAVAGDKPDAEFIVSWKIGKETLEDTKDRGWARLRDYILGFKEEVALWAEKRHKTEEKAASNMVLPADKSEPAWKGIPKEDEPQLSIADEIDADLLKARGVEADEIIRQIVSSKEEGEAINSLEVQQSDERINNSAGWEEKKGLESKMADFGELGRRLRVEIALALDYGTKRNVIIEKLQRLNSLLNEMIRAEDVRYPERGIFRQLVGRVRHDFGTEDVDECELYAAVAEKLAEYFLPFYENKKIPNKEEIRKTAIEKFDVLKFLGQAREGGEVESAAQEKSQEQDLREDDLSVEEGEELERKDGEILAYGFILIDSLFVRQSELSIQSASGFKLIESEIEKKLEAKFGKIWETKPAVYRLIKARLKEKLAPRIVFGALSVGPVDLDKDEKLNDAKRESSRNDFVSTAIKAFDGLPDPLAVSEENDGKEAFQKRFTAKEEVISAIVGRLQAQLLKSDLSRAEIQVILQKIIDELLLKSEVMAARQIQSKLSAGHAITLVLPPDKLKHAADELKKTGRTGPVPAPKSQEGKSDYSWALMFLNKK